MDNTERYPDPDPMPLPEWQATRGRLIYDSGVRPDGTRLRGWDPAATAPQRRIRHRRTYDPVARTALIVGILCVLMLAAGALAYWAGWIVVGWAQ